MRQTTGTRKSPGGSSFGAGDREVIAAMWADMQSAVDAEDSGNARRQAHREMSTGGGIRAEYLSY